MDAHRLSFALNTSFFVFHTKQHLSRAWAKRNLHLNLSGVVRAFLKNRKIFKNLIQNCVEPAICAKQSRPGQ